jgi:flagellin
MTRINTNVGSLVAQNRLNNSNKDLNSALTRLSTGLRINSGKDDPAGLIASEALRSEITSLSKAITNTNRASQIISTADSALGEVSNLLNDVRGLIVEAANTGGLSDEEVAANQLQIDSSLEAINRIAQTTTFQGRKLLDGSLDFKSTASSVASIKDININQANLGSADNLDVEVVVSEAAEQAKLTAATTGFTTAAQATVDSGIEFGEYVDTINDVEVTIRGEGLTSVVYVDDTSVSNSGSAAFDADTGVLTITGNFTGDATANPGVDEDADASVDDIIAAVEALGGFTASKDTATEVIGAPPGTPATVTDLGEGLTISAVNAGADYNNVAIKFQSGTANAATYDAEQKVLTITSTATATGQEIKDVIEDIEVDGEAIFSVDVLDDTTFRNLGGQEDLNTGLTGGEVLRAEVVFQLNGSNGAETFNFGAGTSIDQIASAVNLVSDATGVEATQNEDGELELTSTAYGSDASIDLEIISEGSTGTFDASVADKSVEGKDIVATVNGVEASGKGNQLSVNNSTLNLSVTVEDGSDANFSFSITGGGAKFQLGTEVASTQQARLGIGSVSTGQLGGSAGRLYELGSGQAKSLSEDVAGAAAIVDEVIAKVTSLRGRLGAFQSTTLESNLTSLNETRSNLSEAESTIRDADFAQESANLTRAQILVQSGTNVLSLANQQPQNVLSLLR